MSTGIGVTGVVGIMKNGEGTVVMLRADMDALPVAEATGLPYASTVKAKDEEGVEVGVSHVCGHDLHVIWLMGIARLFSEHKDRWKGTLMAVFQPGEEVGRGAQGMIDDGMMDRISVAKALSLPESPYREIILSSCYFIVIFSIIVQGLTLNKVVDKAVEKKMINPQKDGERY